MWTVFLNFLTPLPLKIFSVFNQVLGFYKGVSASVFTVSLISSVSFGTYRNFLCNICKLRYGTADAKPSGLDVSLAGSAAGAVRVGSKVESTTGGLVGACGAGKTLMFSVERSAEGRFIFL